MFDGYDECPSDSKLKSFVDKLVEGMYLPMCMIVITSRPNASLLLRHLVNQRIEVLGLAKKEQEQYILESLKGIEKQIKLQEYLKRQPIINSLIYVPLHLAILLYLFKQNALPETLTEMNEYFIIHTIYRHLRKQRQLSNCSIWTRALHMYSTLLWYARDVRSQLVIVVYIVVLVLCDLQCLVLVAIVTIIYGGRTLNTTLATRMATPSTPLLEPFNSSKDDWNAWSRRFEQWLTLSSYSTGDDAPTKKRAAFCTYIDSATFKLLCSLCAPKKPEELTFDQLKAKLDSQYGTKKLVLAERYRFYNCKQREGQSVLNRLHCRIATIGHNMRVV